MTAIKQLNRRQALVVLAGAVCLVLAGFPFPLGGFGPLLLTLLLVVDGVLIAMTNGLAFARRSHLDERQLATRDRSYRLGMRLLTAGLVSLPVVTIFSSYFVFLGFALRGAPPDETLFGPWLNPRRIVCIVELLVMAPTLVIAWSTPAPSEPPPRRIARWTAIGAGILAVEAAWLLSFQLPARFAAASTNGNGNVVSVAGADCRQFNASGEVGRGLAIPAHMHAAVCWDGRNAFVFGNPALPPPGGTFSFPTGGIPWLSGCGVRGDSDFGSVSDQTCTAEIDSQGTLHYLFRAQVAPSPLVPFTRDVSIRLVVTRDGRVLQFG